MTMRSVLVVAAALGIAATVWFVLSFLNAGEVPAGPGGNERVVVYAKQRRDRVQATTRYVGALFVIGAGTLAVSRLVRR